MRPAPTEPLGHCFETGTQPFELLAGFVAAVEYVESLGWTDIVAWERELGARFLAGLPETIQLHGLPTMDGRVPTFAFSVEGIPAAEAAARLGERGFAVWHGNYYALAVMKRLGLEDGGGGARCEPRATRWTSAPASASRPPKYAPTPPAPKTTRLSRSLHWYGRA